MEHGQQEPENDHAEAQPPSAPPHETVPGDSPSTSTSPSTDKSRAQTPTQGSTPENRTGRRNTQKTLLTQLVDTNRQLCTDLRESRKEEMELRRLELEVLRESAATEQRLTDALLKYLAK